MFYLGKETYRHYIFNSCVKIGDYIWFTTFQVNALFKLNLITNDTELVTWLPEEPNAWDYYGVSDVYQENLLILMPHNANCICLYDIKNNTIKQILFSKDKMNGRGWFNLFTSCKVKNNNVYFFPGRYPDIICINLDTFELSEINIFNSVPAIGDDNCIYVWNSLQTEKGFLLTCAQSNHIIEYNFDGSIFVNKLDGASSDGFSDIAQIGDFLYLAHKKNNEITIWNKDIIKNIYLKNFKSDDVAGIKYIIPNKDNILVIPMLGEDIFSYNINSEKISSICKLNVKISKEYLSQQVKLSNNILSCQRISDEELLLFSTFDVKIIIMNLKTYECRYYDSRFSDDVLDKINSAVCKDYMSYEYDGNSLYYWLEGLCGM